MQLSVSTAKCNQASYSAADTDRLLWHLLEVAALTQLVHFNHGLTRSSEAAPNGASAPFYATLKKKARVSTRRCDRLY